MKIGNSVPQSIRLILGAYTKLVVRKKGLRLSCQVFHDAHFDNGNLDNDNPSAVISFESLI